VDEIFYAPKHPYTQMLRDQISGRTNSWAIRWYASAFLKDKLTLYPGRSLVSNIGFDGSGTHGRGTGRIINQDDAKKAEVAVEKIAIEENLGARLAVIDFFKSQNSLWARSLRYLKFFLRYASKS